MPYPSKKAGADPDRSALPDAAKTPYDFNLDDPEGRRALAANRIALFKLDQAYRDDHCNVQYGRCRELYEGTSERTAADNAEVDGALDYRMPRVNKIGRAINEHVAAAVQAMPDAPLEGMAPAQDPTGDPLEQAIRQRALMDAVRTFNDWVDTVLFDSEYDDIRVLCARVAGGLGVAYSLVDEDESLDTEHSYELRDLVEQADSGEPWTPEQARRFEALSRRIAVRYLDPERVFWQAYVRRTTSPEMRRMHYVDWAPTEELRAATGNPNIQPGVGPYYVEPMEANTVEGEVEAAREQQHQTAILYTYQKVKRKRVIAVRPVSGEGEPVQKEITETSMCVTAVAGGELLWHKSWTGSEGSLRWPAQPHYVIESINHPYGCSLALILERSERFINLCRFLMFRAGVRGARPNGYAVWLPNLGAEDRAELLRATREGGPAFLSGQGGDQGDIIDDVRKIIAPLGGVSQPLDPALMQAMQIEEAAFQTMSAQVDERAMRSTRTGSGKRAQLSYVDRLRTLTLLNFGRAIEEVKQCVYEWLRAKHRGLAGVPVGVMRPGFGREEVRLNRDYVRENVPRLRRTPAGRVAPVISDAYRTPENPSGIVTYTLRVKLLDTSLVMRARADGRGALPHDPIALQLYLSGLQKAGHILPETARYFALDRRVRGVDDYFRAQREQREEEMLQQAMAEMMRTGVAPPGLAGLLPATGAPRGAPRDGGLGNPGGIPSGGAEPQPDLGGYATADTPGDLNPLAPYHGGPMGVA